jgi:hypothetical protein
MSKKVNAIAQAASIRQLSLSELDAVAGGAVKKPPVCKPTYPKLTLAMDSTS